jgi:anti-anti-sigma regulatory factor
MMTTSNRSDGDGESAFDAIVVSIVGEVDLGRDDDLLDLVIALDPLPETTVDVDMSNVEYVDERRFDSIVKAKNYLQARHCALRLLRPPSALRGFIEQSGLTGTMTVVDDRTS